jgi:hypothetical protein
MLARVMGSTHESTLLAGETACPTSLHQSFSEVGQAVSPAVPNRLGASKANSFPKQLHRPTSFHDVARGVARAVL